MPFNSFSTNRQNYQTINFKINSKHTEVSIPKSMLLIDLIRDVMELKGTKPGCGEGECGACTVLIDGKAVNSCLYLAINVNGKEITTIEGLSTTGKPLDISQEKMIEHGAVQCGFCSPGMVMSITAFKRECQENPQLDKSPESIRKAIEGNLCRCTGYVRIIDAAEDLLSDI